MREVGAGLEGCAIRGRGHCGACFNPWTSCSYAACACHPLSGSGAVVDAEEYVEYSDAVWAAVEGERVQLTEAEKRDVMRLLYDRGRPDSETAEALGCSRQYVSRLRQRYGLTYPVEPNWDNVRRAADGEPMRLNTAETIEAVRILHYRELVDREIAEVLGMAPKSVGKIIRRHVASEPRRAAGNSGDSSTVETAA